MRGFPSHVLMMSGKWGTYWSLGGPTKRIFHLNILPTVTNSQLPGGDPFEKSGGLCVCVSMENPFPRLNCRNVYMLCTSTEGVSFHPEVKGRGVSGAVCKAHACRCDAYILWKSSFVQSDYVTLTLW